MDVENTITQENNEVTTKQDDKCHDSNPKWILLYKNSKQSEADTKNKNKKVSNLKGKARADSNISYPKYERKS